jgi:hypothetical protein
MADLPNPITTIAPGGINTGAILNSVGWLIAGIIVLAAIGFGFWWWYNRKIFNKLITRFELVGDRYEPTFRDTAKKVKLGSGGFEVLYWKAAKTYRIAFGERIGKNTYYFFTAPDGYEYNGVLGRNITTNGRIPIITSNPSMRAQYTALEKQIESLHGDKKTFWDKYGNWVMSMGFVMIIGIFGWLIYKEYAGSIGQFAGLLQKLSELTDNINRLLISSQNSVGGAKLVPA